MDANFVALMTYMEDAITGNHDGKFAEKIRSLRKLIQDNPQLKEPTKKVLNLMIERDNVYKQKMAEYLSGSQKIPDEIIKHIAESQERANARISTIISLKRMLWLVGRKVAVVCGLAWGAWELLKPASTNKTTQSSSLN